MSIFLTPDELAQLTGYQPNQRTRIARWLQKNGIPHTINRMGNPVVKCSDIDRAQNDAEPNWAAMRKTA